MKGENVMKLNRGVVTTIISVIGIVASGVAGVLGALDAEKVVKDVMQEKISERKSKWVKWRRFLTESLLFLYFLV